MWTTILSHIRWATYMDHYALYSEVKGCLETIVANTNTTLTMACFKCAPY